MNGYKNDIITKIKEFVSIESVETEALPNMPFGKGVAEALDYALGLARSFGFNAVNYDNYVGEVEWGEGSETLGILCRARYSA